MVDPGQTTTEWVLWHLPLGTMGAPGAMVNCKPSFDFSKVWGSILGAGFYLFGVGLI